MLRFERFAATRAAGCPQLLPVLLLLGLLALARPLAAAELEVGGPAGSRRLDSAVLLATPATQDIDVPDDVAYGRPMRFRAVPLAPLLAAAGFTAADTVEAVALDGYVAQLPAAALLSDAADGAQAWLAIEPPDAPWPKLPRGEGTAGPFYLVWQEPQAGGITPEQWPFQLAVLRRVAAPAERWPALNPPAGAGSDAQRGLAVFVQHCLPCHRLNGAGEATIGPDLNRPMSPVEYFRPDLLRRYLREPAALRTWPGQGMPGFAESVLPAADLEALLAYLAAMAAAR